MESASSWEDLGVNEQPASETVSEAAPSLAVRLADLARAHGIREVYVFGSRAGEIAARVNGLEREARPSASPEADVDLGVRPRQGIHLGASDRVSVTLALEGLFGVARVDLVLLPEAGAFLALAVVSGELLYCDNSTEQAEYELYVLRRAGDLLPFERARRELILSQGAR
jgi:predicted nucleotidyltransferase